MVDTFWFEWIPYPIKIWLLAALACNLGGWNC
ncbi:hypothetical protein SAMN05444580_11079 [Rhodococcus tukisamuensis]|uniref:Uncharacterized protein n=1 Tax=Rhodococcus tukisamuensis TaxID=168276 RepID=A0A1G7A7B8_9NOCA|nr:hypothetical protein SAMN05444580_11079 [Rhodococcus tukisamuensis]